jgi:Rrf2 family protein
MLSSTCKYAIRAVIYLAFHYEEGKKIGIKQISDQLDIPTPFLGKILQSLVKKKLLVSTKGPNGGFALMENGYSISLYDIVIAVDGDDMFTNCLIGNHPCQSGNKTCSVHDSYHQLRSNFVTFFKEETIGEIVSKMANKDDFIRL